MSMRRRAGPSADFTNSGIALLMAALTSIPPLEAGFRMVALRCHHSVAPVEISRGWGNVMYIPAAPMCEKKHGLCAWVKAALSRRIARRFPRARDYETTREGRFTLRDLNIHGKAGVGMDV